MARNTVEYLRDIKSYLIRLNPPAHQIDVEVAILDVVGRAGSDDARGARDARDAVVDAKLEGRVVRHRLPRVDALAVAR